MVERVLFLVIFEGSSMIHVLSTWLGAVTRSLMASKLIASAILPVNENPLTFTMHFPVSHLKQ